MIKHYTSPNKNRIINFEPRGPKVMFSDGRYETDDEQIQALLAAHPQYGFQFFCEEDNPTQKKENDDAAAVINRELVEEIKRLRAINAELQEKAKTTVAPPNVVVDEKPPDGTLCEEPTADGDPCSNKAKVAVNGNWMCTQHAKIALARLKVGK